MKRVCLLVLCAFFASSCDWREEIQSGEIEQLRRKVAEQEEEIARLKQEQAPRPTASSVIVPITEAFDGSQIDDPFLGAPDAPLVLMVFVDYQSLPCRSFALETLPKLREDDAASGRLKIILRDFPAGAHKHAAEAAQFAHCAGEQGRYWKAHDALFEEEALLERGDFLALAAALPELDRPRFEHCLGSRRYQRELELDVQDGKRLGAKGVPALFLLRLDAAGRFSGVMIRGAQPYALIRAEIERQLALMR